MATLPQFDSTFEYVIYILATIITTLGLLLLGGFAKGIFRSRKKASFKKKLIFFPLFVIGMFGIGWLTQWVQHAFYLYLQQNVATSVSGLLIAIAIAWVLYDLVFWRRVA